MCSVKPDFYVSTFCIAVGNLVSRIYKPPYSQGSSYVQSFVLALLLGLVFDSILLFEDRPVFEDLKAVLRVASYYPFRYSIISVLVVVYFPDCFLVRFSIYHKDIAPW